MHYVTEDFDCNGSKDYALILDKGNNTLAAVEFLWEGSSFRIQELTEFPYPKGERIEFLLNLYKPGRYDTEDPDLEPENRRVIIRCPAVGIGLFRELYEGGRDVYYWENNELRSCLIEK